MLFNRHKAGVGVILRDENSGVILAASKTENEVADLEKIEHLSIVKGLQFCK